MTLLATLQDRFQRGVLDGDDERVLSDIVDSPRETRDVLFGVYRHAYGARLVEILRNDFEHLHAYAGDETFDALARGYVEAHPSDQPNARWFSKTMPEFLRTAAPWCDRPELGDMAEIERALNDCFDASDAPVLTLERLARVAPADWAAMRFVPHPSAVRLDLRTNAAAIWIALKEERESPAAAISGEAERLLVWRQNLVPKFRTLPDDEAMMWDEAAAGTPFGVLCEMLAFRSESADASLRAATLLQGWISSGLIGAAR